MNMNNNLSPSLSGTLSFLRLQKTENSRIIYNILYIIYYTGLFSFIRVNPGLRGDGATFLCFCHSIPLAIFDYVYAMTTWQSLLVAWLDNSKSRTNRFAAQSKPPRW